ncbi:hypothetical protein [Clostridium sp.]
MNRKEKERISKNLLRIHENIHIIPSSKTPIKSMTKADAENMLKAIKKECSQHKKCDSCPFEFVDVEGDWNCIFMSDGDAESWRID